MRKKIEKAISDLKEGKIIIVTDHHDRENEGDFVLAAEFAHHENINFLAKFGRGLICAPLTASKAQSLNLPLMVQENECHHQTAFTVSIDAKDNTSTGISAFDRAHTLRLLSQPHSTPVNFQRPGHIFPLIAKEGGVEERPGHTEATVDLLKLAGLSPVGVICEIMSDNGEMAKGEELRTLAKKYDMCLISIDELINYKKFLRAEINSKKSFCKKIIYEIYSQH